ncbi:MAG: alpha/beta fold hydrolase [Bacteroidia bacterium]|nr:alpha/beta fold hydrolase [Bacteroidia bacterium]
MPTLPPTATTGSLAGLYYDLQGPVKAETLVSLHGFSLRGDVFDRMLGGLNGSLQLLTPDLRGCGRSDRLTGPYTTEQHVTDLAQLLDWLDIPRVHLLGYSYGGAIAQQFAKQYPDRVEKLVLVCSWAFKPQTYSEILEYYFGPTAYRILGSRQVAQRLTPRMVEAMGLVADDAWVEWYRGVLQAYREEVLLAGAEAVFQFDSRRWLRQIEAPTLVVGGAEDSIVPPYHARMLAQGIPGAELWLLPGEGHALPYRQALTLAERVKQFVAS